MPVHHIVWFRNDLRLHDHEPLMTAIAAAQREGGTLLPVYVFDPQFFGTTRFGFERIGPFRRRFLRESLLDLAQRLQTQGSRLLFLTGPAEDVLSQVITTLSGGSLYFHREFAAEEMAQERRVCDAVQRVGGHCHVSGAGTLLDVADLPFSVAETPEVFSSFRRIVEDQVRVPPSVAAPDGRFPPLTNITGHPDLRDLCEIEFLRREDPSRDDREIVPFQGGETAALQRLDHYFWKQDCLRSYKQTRNGMLGPDDSSRLSPWLALGCLSARRIHDEVRRYERQRVRNDSTYWLIFELLWRDYFAFMVAKHGSRVFQLGGLRRQLLPWTQDSQRLEVWQQGKTGFPIIDANMQELAATGFMSNRGRQNVASFLTKNLGVDWRMGAEWFESMLIDYDPCSNYGNWNYTAGVGNDARGFRWFNTIKQARDYDRDGRYVRHWLPTLRNVPSEFIHTPWKMPSAEQRRSSCLIGVDFPDPVVDLFRSAEQNKAAYERTVRA